MAFAGSSILRDTVTMVLAGGQGERLFPLTSFRSKPAVPFGGKYRIIDVALSNCLNSGFRKIYILVQYKSDSLNQHIYEAWNIFNPELGEFVYPVPPQRKLNAEWYLGTANAIYQNLNLIRSANRDFKWALILSGDHIYKMDYLKMMEYHIAQKSDLTMSCIDVPVEEASRFGIVDADAHNRVRGFLEKPSDPPEIPSKPGRSYVNMGIYVFNAKALIDTLEEMESKKVMNHDFGKDVIPYMVKNGMPCHAYPFVDENKKEEIYWKDIGTLDSYYDASMDLVSVVPEFNLYDAGWPLRGFQGQSPPAKLVSHGGERVARAFNSLMCDGAVVSGGGVERSIVGANVRINSFADVRDSIIMNNVEIGRNARVRRAIIDKNVVVPEGFEIGYNPDEDRKRFTTSKNGVVVIPKNYVFD